MIDGIGQLCRCGAVTTVDSIVPLCQVCPSWSAALCSCLSEVSVDHRTPCPINNICSRNTCISTSFYNLWKKSTISQSPTWKHSAMMMHMRHDHVTMSIWRWHFSKLTTSRRVDDALLATLPRLRLVAVAFTGSSWEGHRKSIQNSHHHKKEHLFRLVFGTQTFRTDTFPEKICFYWCIPKPPACFGKLGIWGHWLVETFTFPQTSFLQLFAAGYDHVDLEACKRRGVRGWERLQKQNLPGVIVVVPCHSMPSHVGVAKADEHRLLWPMCLDTPLTVWRP